MDVLQINSFSCDLLKLHAANVGIQAEKLEGLRIAVAKDSPMWETLDVCLKTVDTESLTLLVPRLAQMVRSGVGLNTRCVFFGSLSNWYHHGDTYQINPLLPG